VLVGDCGIRKIELQGVWDSWLVQI
jgi:hypothetical protein